MDKKTLTRGEEIKRVISLAGGAELPLSRPLVMGILNVTPDSFSDGGHFVSLPEAISHALKMEKAGADIIDIGGESTRPSADPVVEEEETRRVVPVITALRSQTAIPISVDTYKARVAKAALKAGADIVNDISALRFDPDMVSLVASAKVPVVLMHMLGTPTDMQQDPHYDNCVTEIGQFFDERIRYCAENGVDKSKLILDPGIGFGKRLGDNLQILEELDRLKEFGLPLLVGASRKSFIGMLHDSSASPHGRLGGSIAAAVMAVTNGADLVRVHDVAETVEALKVVQAIKGRT